MTELLKANTISLQTIISARLLHHGDVGQPLAASLCTRRANTHMKEKIGKNKSML